MKVFRKLTLGFMSHMYETIHMYTDIKRITGQRGSIKTPMGNVADFFPISYINFVCIYLTFAPRMKTMSTHFQVSLQYALNKMVLKNIYIYVQIHF